jgi:hypothetical protein
MTARPGVPDAINGGVVGDAQLGAAFAGRG